MKRAILIISMMLSVSAFAGYTYTITDGMDFNDISLSGTQSILVNGGGGHHLNLNDHSTATINNTSPLISEGYGGIWGIYQFSYSYLEISGGSIHEVMAGTYSHLHLGGGRIDELWSYYSLPDPSRITLVCKPGYQITYTNNLATNISGNWRDGSAFSIKLVNPSGNSSVLSNMTIIPEPVTLALLAMGSLLIRQK